MKLSELHSLLTDYPDCHFRIQLPDGSAVPQSFHVTEVGRVQKTFLDCGGKLRESLTCQLQAWVGPDFDHRIETSKLAKILAKASTYLPDVSIPVEIEYEDRVLSQYTIEGFELVDDAVILTLAHKHTECLAPELCGIPSFPALPSLGRHQSKAAAPCCGPGGRC